jgi:two-component system response regulator
MKADNDIEILLVEDNANDAELAIHALRSRALANKLIHVKDGAEALDFIFGTGAYAGHDIEDHPKVILLDLKLPKVGGLEVLRAIKSNERTKTIPVVVLTSSAQQRDMLDCYQLGANSYIVKPVDFASFTKAVSELGCFWVLLNRTPDAPA